MPKNSTRHAGTNSLPACQDKCEWDSEPPCVENEKGFRVSVDLSEYWGAAAACVAWVGRARGRRLRWLARRLQRAAALRRPFCLLLRGAALAPTDPLRLLQPTDSLRVVPVEHEWQKSFSFCEDEDETESPGPERNGGISPSSKTKRTEPESPAPLLTIDRRDTESSSSPVAMETSATVHRTAANVTEIEQVPVSGFSSVNGDGDEALQSVKRRALALLARVHTGRAAGAADEATEADEADGAPPRRKRRRVRRRNKPGGAPLAEAEALQGEVPAASEPDASACEPSPLPDPTPTLSVQAFIEPHQVYQYSDPRAAPGPALVRNPSPARPPRLVRPLPAPRTPRARPPPTPNTEPAPRAVC